MAATTTTAQARRHGTRTCYAAGCRRAECRTANARYQYKRNQGSRTLVDAEPVRAHIQSLNGQGMGNTAISRQSKVARSVLHRILGIGGYPLAARVMPDTAARLLAVRFELPDHALIDAARTWQIVHGLVAAGYNEAWIAAQIGQVNKKLQLGERQVLAVTARQIEQLAERCVMVPGPCDRARQRASWSHNRWTVDQLWEALDGTPAEDDNEADPVDWVAVELVVAGKRPTHRLDSATRAAAIDLMTDQGMSATQIGLRLGTSASDIARNIARRAKPQQSQETP